MIFFSRWRKIETANVYWLSNQINQQHNVIGIDLIYCHLLKVLNFYATLNEALTNFHLKIYSFSDRAKK